MQKVSFLVDNIKCGGCGNTVTKKVKSFEGLSNIEIGVEEGRVSFEAPDDFDVEAVKKALSKLGYAPQGTASTIQTAKSYVSCAVGRMTAED